ncbi:MAG TPA: NAD-dependent epimerase/dehydratase family protein [bacterium]|nr:NAD-dependent epimerase/dehydratase family protein [bacterium]
MRILITGGAGFIGSHLADALIRQGEDVTIIDDLSTGRMENIAHLTGHPQFHYAIETIGNETVMDRLVSECDIIYHLAAAVGVELIVTRPVEVIERNILGTEAVLKIANRYKKKVFIASTSEIYGKSETVPFREEDDRILGPTTKNRWSYSCSKAIDEFLGLAYWKEKKLPIVIGRFFNTIGPRQTGQYGMVVPRFVRQALLSQPLLVYGDGEQSRCFTSVTDVVRAVIDLMRHPGAVGEIFNIGGSEEITINGLAQRVIAVTQSKSKIRHIPYEEAYESGFEDMRRRVPDISRLAGLTGYRPQIPLDDILSRIAGDLKKNDPEVKESS